MSDYPDGNPKTAVGALKVPLHLVPPSAMHFLALAFKDGAAKYGPYNWREKGVSASVYYGAGRRHFDSWWDGEDLSPDALVHHLGHVMACCAIILDAMTVGKLNDDRPPAGASPHLQTEYASRAALNMVSMDAPTYEEQAVAHHATEALMPPAVEELIARSEDDDCPERVLNFDKPREHGDGTP